MVNLVYLRFLHIRIFLMGFMVDKVTLKRILLLVPWYSPVNIIPSMIHTLIYLFDCHKFCTFQILAVS